MICTLKPITHLEINVVRPSGFNFYSFRIGTLVVVRNRAIIESQRRGRKEIIGSGLGTRKVFRQNQCHPTLQHYFMLFESASCKNSETSCLESRRKFDGVLVKLIRNREAYSSCRRHCSKIRVQLQANIADTTK